MKFGDWPCPQCRKPSSLLATRCPHCTVVWTKDERRGRIKEFWLAVVCLIVIVVALAFWLS